MQYNHFLELRISLSRVLFQGVSDGEKKNYGTEKTHKDSFIVEVVPMSGSLRHYDGRVRNGLNKDTTVTGGI